MLLSKSKITIAEIDEIYPTKPKQKASRRAVAYARYKITRLGKMGAASGVRSIDPATIDLSKYLTGENDGR